MSEALDPYRKWLGIRDPARPPNHYRLLGLEPYEEDRETIANAADRQMAHVRNYQVGLHAAVSQQVLNELAAAKVCLLDPARKRVYDEQLRERAASMSRPSDSAPVEPVPTIVADSPVRTLHRTTRRRSSVMPLFVLLGTLVAVLISAYVLLTRDTQSAPAIATAPAPTVTPPHATERLPAARPRADEQRDSARPAAIAEPEEPTDEQPSRPPLDDALDESSSDRSMSRPSQRRSPGDLETDIAFVRNALSSRDLAGAAERLTALDTTDVEPAQQQVLGQLQIVHDILNQFWGRAQTAVNALQPGDELIVDDVPYTVADLQGDQLVLASRTQRIQFDRSLLPRLIDLPYAYAIALAERGYPAGDPEAKLAIGTFLAFDRYGAPERARRFWEEAARSGVVVAEVLAEWDATQRDEVVAAAERSAGQDELVEDRHDVPNSESRETALVRVRELHAEALAGARTTEQKQALAGEFLRLGLATHDAPDARYVLLDEARTLALAADDLDTALAASSELAKDYQIDLLDEQLTTIERASKSARGKEPLLHIARAASNLIDEAVHEDRFETARGLQAVALSSAQRARDGDLVRDVVADGRRVDRIEQQYLAARSAEETLADDPDDPQANQTWGLYLCLAQQRWAAGLRHLAQGADDELRALAQREIARPFAPDERIDLADGWWDYAAAAGKQRRADYLARAGYWYEQALPFVSGLTRAHVETRLAEIQQTNGRPAGRARGAVDTAAVSVRRLQMVPLSAEYGWQEIPEELNGAFVFAGNRIRQDAAGGLLQFQVLRSGPILLAANWSVDGNLGGEWSQTIVSREQLLARGWKPVGGIMLGNETHELLRRDVKAGDTFTMRTRKYSPPYLIVAGAGATGSNTLPE